MIFSNFLLISTIAVLVIVFLQDLKYRQIHILLPILLFFLSWMLPGLDRGGLLILALINCFFLILTVGLMVLYITIKNKIFINPFRNYFGLGDLLIFASISPLFLAVNYMLFFIGSLVFSLILHFVVQRFISDSSIPLAGYISLLLIGIIFCDWLAIMPAVTLIRFS